MRKKKKKNKEKNGKRIRKNEEEKNEINTRQALVMNTVKTDRGIT